MRPQEAMQVLDTLVIANRIHEETNVQSFLRLVEIYKSRAEKAEAELAELREQNNALARGNLKQIKIIDKLRERIGKAVDELLNNQPLPQPPEDE